MKKTLPFILLLVAVVIGFAVRHSSAPDETVPLQATGTVQAPAATSTAPILPNDGRFSWRFTEMAESAGIPQTRVELVRGTASYDLGIQGGACFVIEESTWTLQADEVSGVICWFAGGGTELGVFREGSRLVVKKGDVDEGDAETPGFRGNLRTVRTLD